MLRSFGRKAPGWHVPSALLATAALTGDLGERIVRRRLPFDTAALSKLSEPAIYSAAKIKRELGFRTKKSFETTAPELVTPRA